MTVFILFCGAGGGVAIGKSKPRIAVVIEVQKGLVDDADSPHESVIHATAKALTASNFKQRVRFAFVEREPTRDYVLIALEGREAWHLEAVAASLIGTVIFAVDSRVSFEVSTGFASRHASTH